MVALADIFEVSLDNLLGREIEVVAKKKEEQECQKKK